MLHGACVFGFGLVLVFGSSVAWAGRGGYFLIPPVYGERDALEVVRTAPLRQWEQGGAFDSAGECEAARVKIVDSAREALASGGEIPQLSPSPRPTQTSVHPSPREAEVCPPSVGVVGISVFSRAP